MKSDRVFDLARLFIENIVGTDNRDFQVMPQILAGFTLNNGGGTRAEHVHGVADLALGQDQVSLSERLAREHGDETALERLLFMSKKDVTKYVTVS
jgi:hypothetical protein